MAASWRALVVFAAVGCAPDEAERALNARRVEAEQIEAQNAELRADLARARASGAALSAFEADRAKLEAQRAKFVAGWEMILARQRLPVMMLDRLSTILSPFKAGRDDKTFWNDDWNRSWDPRGISVKSFTARAREVRITGYARAAADVAEFKHRLTTSELFAGVQPNSREASSLPTRGEAVRFAFDALARYPAPAPESAAVTAPPSAEVTGLVAQGSESSNPDDRLASARKEAARLHDALAHEQARARSAVVELAALKAEREALSEAALGGFATDEEAASFLETTRAMAEAAGLRVRQFERGRPHEMAKFVSFSVTMTTAGTLRELGTLYHSLAKLPQDVHLGDISLKFGDGGEDFENSPVVASYSVSAFALRPPPTVGPSPQSLP